MLVTSHYYWLLFHAADQWLQVHLSRKKIKKKQKQKTKNTQKQKSGILVFQIINVSNVNVKQFFYFCMIYRLRNKVLKLSAKL